MTVSSEAENKEAFDKLLRLVQAVVDTPLILPVHLGGPPTGDVNMNAEYFHNDGKDAETEVLYHEIGHAIDGATYKKTGSTGVPLSWWSTKTNLRLCCA